MTHPPHSGDCEHAPHCSAAKGCAHEYAVLPVSWAILGEFRGGAYFATVWQHPRHATYHRSAAGEPTDDLPKWAKNAPRRR